MGAGGTRQAQAGVRHVLYGLAAYCLPLPPLEITQASRKFDQASAVRADALFVSALQRGEQPSAGQVRQAVAAAVRTFGSHGCAGRVAQEFGDHPETAAARVRWARQLTGEAFSDAAPEPACTPMPARYPAALPA